MPTRTPLLRWTVAALLTSLACARVAQALPAHTPTQLIENLGVEIRQRLEKPSPDRLPEDAEQAVAQQIEALIQSSPGHLSLAEADWRGRTPLMLAVSAGYPRVVKALLTDAGVRSGINVPDAAGETAWMQAQFAPSLTLVACQPGMLTRERFVLLPPYLRRMQHLLQNKATGVRAIAQALEEAGAEADLGAAKRAWLARCPNATPEMRQALAASEHLQATLIKEATVLQIGFNKAMREGQPSIPDKPPEAMRFLPQTKAPPARPPAGPQLDAGAMVCVAMPQVQLRGRVEWTGRMVLSAEAETRAGVVETVDFKEPPLTLQRDLRAADYLRGLALKALAGYQCAGDHIFLQEFRFNIE